MSIFSDKVNKLLPYVPGEQPKDGIYIKLNTNENPYPPSPRVINKIKESNLSELRLYPDPDSSELREIYAKNLNVKKENIFVGNGSDEVLATAFQTFFMNKDNILTPDITYSFYPVYSELYNVGINEIPLKEDFSIDIDDYMINNNGIIFANPNAPTGLSLSRENIENLLINNRESPVIIDEAYVDFGGETVIPLINKYENLLVIRTLSKSYSLAGLRIGFAIGNKKLIEGMNKIKNSFNAYPIDMIAQLAAIEAVKDEEYFKMTTKRIKDTRKDIMGNLKKLEFEVLDSKTNFIFIKHKQKNAKEIFEQLKENKILVRYFNTSRIDNYLRVTIGTDEQMEKFLEVINKIIKE